MICITSSGKLAGERRCVRLAEVAVSRGLSSFFVCLSGAHIDSEVSVFEMPGGWGG